MAINTKAVNQRTRPFKLRKEVFEHLGTLKQCAILLHIKNGNANKIVLEDVTYGELVKIAMSRDNLERYILIDTILKEGLNKLS